jgi:hypothetical protein
MIVGICPTFYWTLMLVTCCGPAFACLQRENMRNLLVLTFLFSVNSFVWLLLSIVILPDYQPVHFVFTICCQIIYNVLLYHHLLPGYQQYTDLDSPSVASSFVFPVRNYSRVGQTAIKQTGSKPDKREMK